jgi:hypothetical protein
MLSTEQPHYAQDGGAEQRREQSEVINAIGLDWAVERHPRSLNADILQMHNTLHKMVQAIARRHCMLILAGRSGLSTSTIKMDERGRGVRVSVTAALSTGE